MLQENIYYDVFLDLTGVVCPMNFVKTKLKLELMNPGEILMIQLDKGEPLKNVPSSLKNEGYVLKHIEDLGSQVKIWIENKSVSNTKMPSSATANAEVKS